MGVGKRRKKPCVAQAGKAISWLCCMRCFRATGETTRGLRSEKGGVLKKISVDYLRVSHTSGIPSE